MTPIMDLKILTETQQAALTDLMVLAMYADGHLAIAEETRIRELLGRMGIEADSDRDRKIDASLTRVRQHVASAEAAQAYAAKLAGAFQVRNERRQVLDFLDALLATDSHITLAESSLSTAVREALRL